jgi:acetyl esterase
MPSPSISEESGPPPEIAARIRALGAVLDMRTTQQMYAPLLARQSFAGVKVERDLAYGPDVRHRLDVYRSEGTSGALQVLVVFHGGGFVRGDKQERENAGLYFARAGYLVIVPNYRLGPAHHWPAGAEDVRSVIAWTQAHAADYGARPERPWLLGESAGAAHVATATLMRRFHPANGLAIAGAILVSGVYNVHLERLARAQFGVASPDPRNEPYFGSDFASYPSKSLVEHVDAQPFPLLMTYAELDLLPMQVQAGELFARLVVKHGFTPQLRVIPAHNHLSQIFSVNTGDTSLSAPVLQFMRESH